MKRKYFSVLFLLLIVMVRLLASEPAIMVMRNLFKEDVMKREQAQITIVIDPGHGGRDPGKVGVSGTMEKDINLAIALRLKNLLEQNDINIIMTRTEDVGLYSETDSNKKRTDLNKRVEIINSSNAVLAISIHQNSFSQSNVKGAQVFYHSQSEQGRNLAITIQEQLKETIKDGNHRRAKSNTSYYMLKHTTSPLVIVECGYLSNYTEEKLLIDEDYQEKISWAIHLGIMKYLKLHGKKYKDSVTKGLVNITGLW